MCDVMVHAVVFRANTVKTNIVGRLYIATEQYSSFGGCALGLMIGVLDIVGDEVRNREQVDARDSVEARETEEEDKTGKNKRSDK